MKPKQGRKKFHEVEIPLMNDICHLIGRAKEEIVGKTIKLDLSRKLRGKSVELKLRTEKQGEKVIAVPISMRILPFYIRRIMRKRTSYVEDSFSLDCKDATLKIKPLLITRKKVSRIVKKTLREKAKGEIKEYLEKEKIENIFEDLMSGKFQKTISLRLKKIYPLLFFDLRIFEAKRTKTEKKVEEKVEKEKKKPIKKKETKAKEKPKKAVKKATKTTK